MGVPLGRFTARSEWISNDAIEKGCSTRHKNWFTHRQRVVVDRTVVPAHSNDERSFRACQLRDSLVMWFENNGCSRHGHGTEAMPAPLQAMNVVAQQVRWLGLVGVGWRWREERACGLTCTRHRRA